MYAFFLVIVLKPALIITEFFIYPSYQRFSALFAFIFHVVVYLAKLLYEYIRIYTHINSTKIILLSNLDQTFMKMVKSIIFLNPHQVGDDEYAKLIIKDNCKELADRLKDLPYLEFDSRTGTYMMPKTEHFVQMLSDNTDDVALLNTSFMTRAKVITDYVRIDQSKIKGSRQDPQAKGQLTILPLLHEGRKFALLKFHYHPGIYQKLKMLDYIKYSKTYKRFVTHLDEEHIRKLVNDIAGVCQIQLNSKIEINNISLQKLLWEQAYTATSYVSCPDAFLERMRLKNYSINTIRTYHQMLLKYLNSFNSNIEIINSYTEQEINTYHRNMIQVKKYSYSTINQSLNAI